jgi:RNA polymerase sigma factor (sigma-70 family)
LPDRTAADDARFPTTRGSAVRGAASGDPRERERAWNALVAAYWKPAYKHVRIRWRAAPEDAEDTIQGFFERAMEKGFFASYDPGRGRFRTFLRVCLDRHVANEDKARRRQKRGGGAAMLSLDFGAAEEEIARAGAAAWASPEECFDLEWRRSVFALAVEALGRACAASGRSVCFVLFERYDLAVERRPTYEELGRELGIPATTVTNHLAFARRELRRLVVAQLREITGGEDELEAEARLLLGARPR